MKVTNLEKQDIAGLAGEKSFELPHVHIAWHCCTKYLLQHFFSDMIA